MKKDYLIYASLGASVSVLLIESYKAGFRKGYKKALITEDRLIRDLNSFVDTSLEKVKAAKKPGLFKR